MEQFSREQVLRSIWKVRDAACEYAIETRRVDSIVRAAEGKPLAFPRALELDDLTIRYLRNRPIEIVAESGSRNDIVMRVERAAHDRIRFDTAHAPNTFHHFRNEFVDLVEPAKQVRDDRAAELLDELGEIAQVSLDSDMDPFMTEYVRDVQAMGGIHYNLARFVNMMTDVHPALYLQSLNVIYAGVVYFNDLTPELINAGPITPGFSL